MRFIQLFRLIGACALLSGSSVYAQRTPLQIEQIMQGERFVGYSPENISWSEDGKTVFFSWNPEKDTLRSTYKIEYGSTVPKKVTSDEQRSILPASGEYSYDYSKKLFAQHGDLFMADLSSGRVRVITQTTEREDSPAFTADQHRVTFLRNNNLYVWDMLDGSTVQWTDFRSGSEPAEKKASASDSWLHQDQLQWFDVLEWRKAQADARSFRDELLAPKRPATYYSGSRVFAGIQASPDLRFITFRLLRRAESKRTEVPGFVTASGYTEGIPARAKVGGPQDTQELGIYDVRRDTFYFLDTRQIPGIFDKPAFLKDYHRGEKPYSPQFDKPREVNFSSLEFSRDGKAFLVIRSQDNKDRWIMAIDLETARLRLLDRQRDEAWIGGPGIGWSGGAGNVGWMPDQEHIWFQSEESGYSQLYQVHAGSGEKKALSTGSFEIINAVLSRDKQWFFITANAEGPHERHFYRMPVSGGTLERITTMPGNHEVVLSPDESRLAVRYSYSNKPWELYLMENKPGATAVRATHSTTAAFEGYPWRDPEVVWFKARDGVAVPARIYRPARPVKGGPAVLFVHGAGYTQNVHKWWSSYFREFMFHNFLADHGYTVLDIDYRASEGYGRDWRTAIYRHMGGKDLQDQLDGAQFLVRNYQVDPSRIGIYGGSYGGFITLMALFTSPETFRAGAALRAVTDWAHYNHGYTSNILNTPVEDSIAYRQSSPIYFAEGLKSELLILHGMVDTNVHFQDVVRLAQRLIELKKENWEFAVFPMEDHGFVEPSSWTDEYRRIFALFERTLKKR